MSNFKVASASVTVVRNGESVHVSAGKAFDFTAEELKTLDNAQITYRDPVNEADGLEKSTAIDIPGENTGGKGEEEGSAEEDAAATLAVVKKLLEDKGNLNTKGVLDLAKLNAALKEQDLPEVKAAERDSLVEQADVDNGGI